jgi:hypothetical protein
MLDVDKNEIVEARKVEVAKLEYFQAFEWVTCEEAEAQGLKYIKSRWEDVRKYDAREASSRSRWVLQDFRGKQAEPTMFAPTPSLVAVRVVEAIGVQSGWDLVTGDVSTAYMHAPERDLVVTDPPDGWKKDNMLWKLVKNINGRRTGACNWLRFFTECCKNIGLSPLKSEPCIFKDEKSKVILVVHVDDLLATSESSELATCLKGLQDHMLLKLDKPFDEDGGCFLGLKKIRTADSLASFPSQKLLDEIFGSLGLDEKAVPVSTPGSKHWPQEPLDDEYVGEERHRLYRNLVGKLQWSCSERPDVKYCVKELARSLAKPTYLDMRKAKRIGRYLLGTRHYGVRMIRDEAKWQFIDCYCDANWAHCQKTRKSSNGLVLKLGSKAMLCQSKTQSVVAQSSAESELLSMHYAYIEAALLRTLIEELLGYTPIIRMHTDSSAARAIGLKSGLCGLKHIDIKVLLLQQEVADGRLCICKIDGRKNSADLLTKEVDGGTLSRLIHFLGIHDETKQLDLCEEEQWQLVDRRKGRKSRVPTAASRSMLKAITMASMMTRAATQGMNDDDNSWSFMSEVLMAMLAITLSLIVSIWVGTRQRHHGGDANEPDGTTWSEMLAEAHRDEQEWRRSGEANAWAEDVGWFQEELGPPYVPLYEHFEGAREDRSDDDEDAGDDQDRQPGPPYPDDDDYPSTDWNTWTRRHRLAETGHRG